MKSVIFATLLASASAFAPASQSASSTALKADFSKEVGAQVPLGYFDPAGLSEYFDQDDFDRLRGVEIKHGRIAMLAVVGYLTTYAGVRFPGADDIPCGFAALSALPGMVWAQMIATLFIMEYANRDQKDTPGVSASWSGSEFPGDCK